MPAVGAVGLSAQLASHGKSVVAGTEFPASGDDLSSVGKYPLSEERPDAGYRTFSAYPPAYTLSDDPMEQMNQLFTHIFAIDKH